MEIAIRLVLILHFIGLAMLLGGALSQMSSPTKGVIRVMVDGAYTQVVTGIALLGLVHANHEDVSDAKFGVKLVIAIVIAVLCAMNAKKTVGRTGVWAAVLGLTLTNIAIAVLWQ
jgi:hypothetical protein